MLRINKKYIINQKFSGVFLFFLTVFLMSVSMRGEAPVYYYSGMVVDSETEESIPFANIVSLKNPKRNFVASGNGAFILRTSDNGGDWFVSAAGFEDYPIIFDDSDSTHIIRMKPLQVMLEELVIRPSKEKYSKRNNPAVDFMKAMKNDYKERDPRLSDFYSYDKYEKTLIALNSFNKTFDKGFLSKGGKFLENYVDTSSVTGQRILDLMLKEKISTNIYSNSPHANKEVVRGYRSDGIDEVINQENMRIILEDAVREIDVSGDNITLLQNRFVSPFSIIGPDFYKYYLTDTIIMGNEKCIELSFLPRNPESMGFNGKIYVAEGDSGKYVKKITMRSPADINLNLVDNIFISLAFEIDSIGNHHKVYDDVCLEFSLIPHAPKLYGRKTTVYSNFSYTRRDDLDAFYSKLGESFVVDEARQMNADFWNTQRMVPLTAAESRMGKMMREARGNKFILLGERIVRLLESGYVKTGKESKVDLGPINTLISGNTVEGVRLRLGGMTMAPLNKHWFGKGYVAYGTKDKKWKFDSQIEYSFSPKAHHSYEWPRHGFFCRYGYDLDMLGQHYLFTNSDNVFLSLKRKKSNLTTYRRIAELGYILELRNNFSVETKIKSETQEATEWIPFIFSDGSKIGKYRQSNFSISLRWAPGEKFVQGRTTRSPVNMDAWILQFTHEYGPKWLWKSAFGLNRSELSLQKRLWLSAFGYTDMILKGGIVWSSVYFPSLMWPNANLSYTIQPESYSLLNPMEFANDKYASFEFTYYGMGILFNRIPLIKRLKLREVVTFKGLMGGLSDCNNPELNGTIPLFPVDSKPRVMSGKPYMEAGIGLDNILMFLRVDYVWRLTYRDTPGCDKSGLRVSLHFSF